MKTVLLTLGVFVCSGMTLLKIWGLIFVDFSVKQLVYTAFFAAAAASFPPSRACGRTSPTSTRNSQPDPGRC